MGPYYITDLVNLLGPVERVAGMTARRARSALITSEPMNGTRFRSRSRPMSPARWNS